MALKWKCVLDNASVLTGYAEVEDSTLQPGDVVFDTKPDLEPGHYRWNGETFTAARNTQLYAPDGPDPWYAVYRFMLQEAKRRKALGQQQIPEPCLVWLDYFRRSFTQDDPV